jgi:acyl dehydratase
MALDHTLVGAASEPTERTWTSTDAILYALGVGAGADDPVEELEFTTENTAGVEQKVLPTFAVLAAQARNGKRRKLGDFDPAKLVHAEQGFEIHRPLPVEATVRVTSTVTGMHDKGSGALVTTESVAVDASDGTPIVTTRGGVFIRGESSGTSSADTTEKWERPDRDPDATVVYPTKPDQALLYRLSGDRNPLHADPAFAARGGFERPILHGLCTYGFTGRALLHALCGSDPARFESMYGRFSRPVLPGQDLVVSIWRVGDGEALFQTTAEGAVVIDRGRARFH